MMRYMLTVDGLWPQCAPAVRRVRIAFMVGLLPRLLAYFRPSYHPSQHADPPALHWWLQRYAAGDDLRTITPAQLEASEAQSRAKR